MIVVWYDDMHIINMINVRSLLCGWQQTKTHTYTHTHTHIYIYIYNEICILCRWPLWVWDPLLMCDLYVRYVGGVQKGSELNF